MAKIKDDQSEYFTDKEFSESCDRTYRRLKFIRTAILLAIFGYFVGALCGAWLA
jgi:hypothetical protein